jgi:hypothetical protein
MVRGTLLYFGGQSLSYPASNCFALSDFPDERKRRKGKTEEEEERTGIGALYLFGVNTHSVLWGCCGGRGSSASDVSDGISTGV